ncbi:MAG: hypothetical protein ACR2ND_00300 [Solirubrobacteraceae bacterium]
MLLSALATLAALAPSLKTDAPCYLPRQPVKLAGAGFTPKARYTVTLDRAPVGTGTVAADGKLAGTLSSGTLTARQLQRRHLVAVHDGPTPGGHAGFEVSALSAAFAPTTGDPRTLRVHFSVNGIGAGVPGAAPARVWLHYLDPRGHLHTTVSVGLTSGPCGTLKSRKRLRLFPFAAVAAGRWTLQFDLSRTYYARAQPRITRLVAVK